MSGGTGARRGGMQVLAELCQWFLDSPAAQRRERFQLSQQHLGCQGHAPLTGSPKCARLQEEE